MGFWKTLGRIASVAAPIAAAPFTGGASLALIAAGAGAANGALSGGGVKGALLGAGLGAATGGFGGGGAGAAAGSGVKSAIGAGVKGAAMSAFKDPNTYLKLAGDVSSVLGKQQEGKAKGKEAQAELQQRQDQLALQRYQMEQGAQNQAGQLDLQRKGFEQNSRGTNAKQALIGALLGGGVTPTSIAGGQASGGLLRSLNGNPNALAAMKTLGQQGSAAQSTPLAFEGGKMISAPQLATLPKIDQGGILSTLANIGQLAGAASPYLQHGGGASGDQPQGLTKNSMGYTPSAPVGNAFQGGAVAVPHAEMLLPTDDISNVLARLQFQQNGGRG